MAAVTDRVLPHSLEAEKAILGALLLDPHAWPKTAPMRPGDFFRKAHQEIFGALAELAEKRVEADLVTLKDALQAQGLLDEVGGPSYVAALLDGVPRSTNVESYAGIVREKARLRRLIELAGRLLADAYGGEREAAAVAADAVRHLAAVAVEGGRGGVSVEQAVKAYLDALDADTSGQVRSGYADLDELTGGFRPGELTIVAARPAVGKSAFAIGASDMIAQAGTPVAYFSPEMTVEQLSARLVARRSRVSSAVLERKQATDAQYARVAEAIGQFGDLPLYLYDAVRSVVEVEAWTRRLQHERGVACVFVDYLQVLLPARERRSREEEVARIADGLKALAKDLRIVVVALAQLGRASDDRRDKRPRMSDLRESGNLEQAADTVILLYREELHKRTAGNAGIAEAILAKQRMGPTGVTRLAFNQELARFDNLASDRLEI